MNRWRGTDAVPIASERIRSLLAWLALHVDQPQPRVRLASTLWPDSREAQARTNLRNLVHQLRRAFAEIGRYIDIEGSDLTWLPGAPLWIDVHEFELTLARARVSTDIARVNALLERAIDLYRGPLLPDWYESWLAPEQERLRGACVSALEQLLDVQLTIGAYIGRQEARADLKRALESFVDAGDVVSVAAGRIILERLTRKGES